jgi:hypothetical protein
VNAGGIFGFNKIKFNIFAFQVKKDSVTLHKVLQMQATYHLRIKKDYAATVIEGLQKMKAVELLKEDNELVPEWQKKEIRKRIKESQKNPSILVDEDVIFNMLNSD